MLLKDYLIKQRLNPAMFSKKTGISYTSIYRYLRGSTKPTLKNACIIEKATDGQVTFEDLLNNLLTNINIPT
jgi:hypothetical protein